MADLRTLGFYSLFGKSNKKKSVAEDNQKEGVIDSLDYLELDKPDEDLIQLTKSWELSYSSSLVKARIHNEGDVCEKYWVGRQRPEEEYADGKRPLTDNVIFEALETMIPQATQQNPEPVVLTDNGVVKPEVPPTPPSPKNPQGTQGTPPVMMSEIGDKVHMSLEYLADVNNLKMVLGKGVRHWTLRFVGVYETSWNGKEGEIEVDAVNPKELILDKNAYVRNGVYHGEYIGRRLFDIAQNLITRFPKKENEIKKACQNKLGSLMGYIRWRTDEFVVYTMADIVLFKHKNEMWNYTVNRVGVDDNGEPTRQEVTKSNHWSRPKIPMRFLTVFDLGDEPADKTSLVAQSIVTQDHINKRLKQIDRNTDNINGGIIVNGRMYNREQAAAVADARRGGRTIVSPGDPREAIMIPNTTVVPDSLYKSLEDSRQRLLERFGVAGSTATGQSQEQTVRGKIISGNADTSRVGGGVSKALEIVAAGIYEDMLQAIYVFWDEPHWVSVAGPDNAQQMMQFQASEIPQDRRIVISVQDGSMVPQDALSRYNEAMAEWEGGISDPLSYFEKVKDPNPLDRAQKLMQYKTNPAQYMAEYLQIQAPPNAQPIAEGGGGSASGAPPASVTSPPPVADAVSQQENNIISSVPINH